MRRVLASAVAIVAAVSLTVWIRDRAPHPEDWQRPFLRDAVVGEAAPVQGYSITVESVVGARNLVFRGASRPSGGVWLVIGLAVRADRAPALPNGIQLVDAAGRTYAVTDRFDQALMTTPVQPGTVVNGAVAFEVPFDVGDRVYLRAGPRFDDRLDAVANIEVPIAAGEWQRWMVEDSSVEMPPRSVEAG